MFRKAEMAEWLATVTKYSFNTLMRYPASKLWEQVDHYTTPGVLA